MKKLLLTTALVGVAFVAAPAQAEVSLNLGGHFKGYVTFHNQDDGFGVADERSFDMIRETEVHFTGETTLDNGLTVGFHIEAEADGGDGFEVEESYAYFAGNWGRLNVGAEDGAAYLLQVAAPSADTNVDGIRQYVSPVNYAVAPLGSNLPVNVDYAQDVTGYADKLTYITPVFNGFQAALSYAFDVEDNGGYAESFGVRTDDVGGVWGDAYEAAVRYEGNFNAVRLTLGAGYTHVELESAGVVPVVPGGIDGSDRKAWNIGGNVGFGPFNVGLIYKDDNNGLKGSYDTKTWVLGADYTTGPWVLGASYYDREDELGAGAADLDTKRYSAGVTYTYGPGMTFRGSVHHIEHDVSGVGDIDATSVLLGTQINF